MEIARTQPVVGLAGCGAVTALGAGVERLEQALRANVSGLHLCERLRGRGYQSAVAGPVPDEVLDRLRGADPRHADARAFLLAETALREAEQNAASALETVPLERRGLVLSTTKADIEALEKGIAGKPCSPAAARHLQPALLARDLAAGRAGGPVQCVSVACISGLLAIQLGARLIQRHEADLVLVVGVDLLSHFVLAGFTTLKALDPEGCRPFDRTRLGLSVGEGAGAVVLVRSDLCKVPTAMVRGWGVSNDANHLTGPSRDGSGLALAITRALNQAALKPADIDYLNMHGTGTTYNDAMESLALRTVFGERVPPFSASKGMLGHTLGAAGVLESILCVLALRLEMMPGTPRLREADPSVPGSVVIDPRPAPGLRRLVKVNCGFGGTNGALVLERARP